MNVGARVAMWIRYKEGNNRPSSVNKKSLVHNHDKAGNKCDTQYNMDTRVRLNMGQKGQISNIKF